MSVTTNYDLHQKILDLQIICSKKDIEIYKLKKQINNLLNDTVINFEKEIIELEIKDTNGLGVALGEPLLEATLPSVEVKKEKMIQVKVKECGDCRSEDRRSFPTKGYKCEDEECMNFK
jgi:hypothetical protein